MPLRAACICPRDTFHAFLHKLYAAVRLLVLNVHIVRLLCWPPDSSTFTMGLFEWTQAPRAQIERALCLKMCVILCVLACCLCLCNCVKRSTLKFVCVIQAIAGGSYSMRQCVWPKSDVAFSIWLEFVFALWWQWRPQGTISVKGHPGLSQC